MNFTSTSQAGQDRFVWAVTKQKRNGTFLDIGAWPFVGNSNSLALEQQGWRGLLVDTNDEFVKKRRSPFVQGDAVKLPWLKLLNRYFRSPEIDFLSLDVDDATTDTLLALPLNQYKFGIICIEHDSYHLGPGPRDVQRGVLALGGYSLVCEDVMVEYPTPGNFVAFEDWWVSPKFEAASNRFRCKGKKWMEIGIA